MNLRGIPIAILVAVIVACGPAPPSSAGRDTIVLLGGNVLAETDRVARLLADMAGATDVLGPARFEVVSRAGASPTDLADMLGEVPGDVRAVVAIVGDLGLLDGIDPNQSLPAPGQLTSRQVDLAGVEHDLERLNRAVVDRGARLIVATAPLGKQGRIEVPELVTFATWLRNRGPVLDLAATFSRLESSPLLANGIDRLDEYGHDELARALYTSILEQPDLWPPRTEEERYARLQMRALGLWANAFNREFRMALETLQTGQAALHPIAGSASAGRQAARQLALVTLQEGLTDAIVERWKAIPAAEQGDVPGLAVGRTLSGVEPQPAPPEDSLERELVELVAELGNQLPDGWDRARAFVARHPHRIEAWLTLEATMWFTGQLSDVRGEALAELGRYGRGPVALKRCAELLDDQLTSLRALPALVIASRPFVGFRPTGPVLDEARRATRTGFFEKATNLLDRAFDEGSLAPGWRAERERIARLVR